MRSHGTTVKTEILAGLTSYLTVVYVIAVNAAILFDAGIPYSAGMLATILTGCIGCLLMGLWANSPIVLVPGMGVNALFTYTIVHSLGLAWQEALAAVFVSGLIFTITAFTRYAAVLALAIPQSLKEGITVGIGLFLTFIGLQKGGLVVPSETTFVAIGHLGSPQALTAILTLLLTVLLFARKVTGTFLIAMGAGTLVAALFGLVDFSGLNWAGISFAEYASVFGQLSFDRLTALPFWIAAFSLTMVVLFENMGLLYGLLPQKISALLPGKRDICDDSRTFGHQPDHLCGRERSRGGRWR